MKLDVLETHDRYEYLMKDQSKGLCQGAEDCLKKNELSLTLQGLCPYIYIFAHPRTADDGVTKRMLWQPRLTKPKPQTNSYLFRALSKSDILEICWLLPPKEMWDQYKNKNVTESDLVAWSIWQFINNRKQLEAAHPDDLPEERMRMIYQSLGTGKKFLMIN